MREYGLSPQDITDVVITHAHHDHGSSIVIADRYVFCGDECYYEKNLTEKIMSGSVYCMDKHKAFIEEYSKDKYIPFTCHDPEIMRGVKWRT